LEAEAPRHQYKYSNFCKVVEQKWFQISVHIFSTPL
jgi:hypothetical protein